MPKINELTPLGANASPEDFALIVQGGVTKRIKIKNLLKGVAGLAAGSFAENNAYVLVVRSGVPYRMTLEDWAALYSGSYELGVDWTMLHYYEIRDVSGNWNSLADYVGGTSTGGGGTFSSIPPTATTPVMTRCVPTATAGTGHYVTTSVDHGYSNKAAGAFFGVKFDAPAVNIRITLGMTSGLITGIQPVPLIAGGLLAAVVDTRTSQNWQLIISNNGNPAPFTTEVLDTGVPIDSAYQLIGVLWDPAVGLHFLKNNAYVTTLVPADLSKYQGMLLRPAYSGYSAANGVASGLQLSNWYSMFKNT